jgi:hypothetical protein
MGRNYIFTGIRNKEYIFKMKILIMSLNNRLANVIDIHTCTASGVNLIVAMIFVTVWSLSSYPMMRLVAPVYMYQGPLLPPLPLATVIS